MDREPRVLDPCGAGVVGPILRRSCNALKVSLPMLAPLLLGTGMMLRSIRSNASIIFPRICVLVVLLYVLWFANSLVQSTVVYLRRQVGLPLLISPGIVLCSGVPPRQLVIIWLANQVRK